MRTTLFFGETKPDALQDMLISMSAFVNEYRKVRAEIEEGRISLPGLESPKQKVHNDSISTKERALARAQRNMRSASTPEHRLELMKARSDLDAVECTESDRDPAKPLTLEHALNFQDSLSDLERAYSNSF